MKSKELFDALALLEEEKGITVQFMIDKISKAIVSACKNSYNGNENVIINVDRNKNKFDVYLRKRVTMDVLDPGNEISLFDARKIMPNAAIDEEIPVKLDTKEFGRIAAQTARNIIRQGIRDGERDLMLQEFESRKGEVVTAVVEKIEPKNGAASIRIGKVESFLPKTEQLPNEKFKESDLIKVYIVDVRETDRGPKAILSRTHADIIRKMFEAEIPEIYNGIVEIKSVSREAGSRSKVAVLSHDPNVDPIGACIGQRGARVSAIINEFCGEKIDIVEYSDDPAQFITTAISPAEVVAVKILDDETPSCCVIVPDSQLSLAIGNKGQNARLAAKLTGFKIDIKPLSSLEADETLNENFEQKEIFDAEEAHGERFETDEGQDENIEADEAQDQTFEADNFAESTEGASDNGAAGDFGAERSVGNNTSFETETSASNDADSENSDGLAAADDALTSDAEAPKKKTRARKSTKLKADDEPAGKGVGFETLAANDDDSENSDGLGAANDTLTSDAEAPKKKTRARKSTKLKTDDEPVSE